MFNGRQREQCMNNTLFVSKPETNSTKFSNEGLSFLYFRILTCYDTTLFTECTFLFNLLLLCTGYPLLKSFVV